MKPIFLTFSQITEKLNAKGIEFDKKQMQSIFKSFDIMNEAGTIGVKDNKLTGSEITKFLVYIRENYVEKFSQAFSDISENLRQKDNSDNQPISENNEFYSPKRSVQLYNKLMPEFNKLSDEQKNRVKELLYIEGRGENYQLGDEDLLAIGKLSQEDFEKIKEFLVTPNRVPQYNYGEMQALASIPKDKHYIFNNPARGDNQISPSCIYAQENLETALQVVEQLASLKVKISDEFGATKNTKGERILDYNSEIIELMSNISKEADIKKVIDIMQDPIFSDCNIYDVFKMLKISDEQLKKVKEILQNPPLSKSHLLDGALDLSKLTPEEFRIAQNYYNVPERGTQQLTGSGIASLAKLTDDERKFAQENGLIYSSNRKRQLNGSVISSIAKMKSKDLQEFINKNPDFYFKPSINEESIVLIDKSGIEYSFDKNGLVSKKELISNDNLPDGRNSNTFKITNFKLHTEQEITYVELEKTEPTVHSIKTKYYDENNNLLKTLTLNENSNSSYDASLTYPNGKTVPIQHASYNEALGTETIERHFVSPEGVKTEYFYEESVDGSRIVNYTITDAEGNTLLDEHNTFQQISENEFISSSNGKSYKVEFKDGNILITDTKNNKQHSVSIANLITTPEQKNIVINYLKNIPASQLMFLKEQPIRLAYDNYLSTADNGSYQNSTKELVMSHPLLDKDLNLTILSHEWGHYIDLYLGQNGNGKISGNEEVNAIYQEELANFLKNTNSDEQARMSYLMKDGMDASERVADSNALRQTGKQRSFMGIRDFYYQQYFPRTIAKIVELLQSEEARVAT